MQMRDLIAERHRAGLRQVDIAQGLGMTRSRLALLEAAIEVQPTEEWARRYMAVVVAAPIATPGPDPREYRNVIGRFATGVTVVTWDDGEHRRGMTANAVASLSLDPLLLLVCVDRKVSAHSQLESAQAFAVNILAVDQIPVSMAFAQHGLEDMADVPYHLGTTGSPLIEGALAWLECAITERLPGGDHTIMVGRLVDFALARPEAEPLLYYGGDYVSLGAQLP